MKENNPLISVIIPVYNVEKYLNECINSVVNQTYKNLEIILVDDGSTDDCPQLCDSWQSKDKRIKVIHKQNGGLSSARNVGIENSIGEYIAFIDSDDYVEKDYIEFLHNLIIQKGVDISCCESFIYYSNEKIERKKERNIEIKFTNIEALKCLNIIQYFNCGAWCKLYKRKLFEKVRFPIGKKSEDLFVMPQIIYQSNGLYFSSVPKYYYRQRKGSITHSFNINYDFIEAAKDNLNFCKQKNVTIAIPYATQFYAFACMGTYNALLCRTKDKLSMKKIRKDVLSKKEEIIYNDMSAIRKIQLYMFLHCIGIYNIAFKLFDKIRNKKYGE